MYGITDLYLFILAGMLLNITPGADMLYILNNTFSKGFKSGIIASLGISTGCLFHVFLAVVGLSALLQASPSAFMFVKYIGVVYLIYLGITLLLSSSKSLKNKRTSSKEDLKKVFINGVLINMLNPKVALFFITFLPQFVSAQSSSKSMALLTLGLIFISIATIISIITAYISLHFAKKFSYTSFLTNIIKKLVGLLFISFGIKLASSSL